MINTLPEWDTQGKHHWMGELQLLHVLHLTRSATDEWCFEESLILIGGPLAESKVCQRLQLSALAGGSCVHNRAEAFRDPGTAGNERSGTSRETHIRKTTEWKVQQMVPLPTTERSSLPWTPANTRRMRSNVSSLQGWTTVSVSCMAGYHIFGRSVCMSMIWGTKASSFNGRCCLVVTSERTNKELLRSRPDDTWGGGGLFCFF